MLTRAHRMTRGQDFVETIRRGRRAGTPTVVLHLLPGEPGAVTVPRVGFVVNKAVGNAVTRNQVKRRLRHASRSRLGVLPDGARLVVRALPSAASSSSDTLCRDLDGALQRLQSLR